MIFLEPYESGKPSERIEEGIRIWNGIQPTPGLRFMPRWLKETFMRKNALNLEERLGQPFDVIWSFDNSRYFNLLMFTAEPMRIHHIMDDNMEFQLESACTTADVCLGVTHSIVERMSRFNSNAHFIQHGFRPQLDRSLASLPEGKEIRCFYAGNLAIGYLNWNWIKRVVGDFRNVQFIFAGNHWADEAKPQFRTSVQEGISWLQAQENVALMGPVPSSHIEGLCSEADILLLVYDHHRFGGQVHNSHKIMEYLGSGKVVVGNLTEAYRDLSLLEMADSEKAFATTFAKVVDHLDDYNSDEAQQRRKSYAWDHTYGKQLERIESLLKHG